MRLAISLSLRSGRLFAVLTALALPLQAQVPDSPQADPLAPQVLPPEPPLSLEEFDAYVTGRTLTYAQGGWIYGTEEYLPGRRARWQRTEDICQYGTWFAKGDQICFVYDDDPDEHCWKFWAGNNGLRARSASESPGSELSEVQQSDHGLSCQGPDVGV